jgi:hypothetical protein
MHGVNEGGWPVFDHRKPAGAIFRFFLRIVELIRAYPAILALASAENGD